MNKPFARNPPPISYAEGPRLRRAVQVLSYEEQVRFFDSYNAHLSNPRYQSIQRRGSLLCIVIDDAGAQKEEVYDFGAEMHVQRCLAALTDCLRSHRAAVKVLMPSTASAPSQSAQG